MTDLTAPGRLYHPDDHVVMEVDIEDCPVADVPLTEIFDTANLVLIDDYLPVLKTYIVQQIEDTIWLDDQSTTPLFNAGFATFHRKTDGTIQSLRKPSLQRLIEQTVRNRPSITDPVRIQILIRFQIPIAKLPRQSRSPPTVPSIIGGRNDDQSNRQESPAGSSGTRSSVVPHGHSASSQEQGRVTAPLLRFTGPPLLDDTMEDAQETPAVAGRNPNDSVRMFRGLPVDVPEPTTRSPRPHLDAEAVRHPEDANRAASYLESTEPRGPRGRLVFQTEEAGTPRTQYTHASGRTMNSHAPITYGAESFEDYMRQFMSSEVRYKDFRKTIVQKFDSSRQDSFIHWYKLFCSTCLQWGLWCPPYESVEQDNIHGSWWLMLPASVRAQDTFMSSLLYGVLSQETVFPAGSREHSAVQGCAANAGYDAIYSLLRLHHPRLQAALHTVNEIPRQRRAELFSSYLRRLQDFMARERVAGRNYSEYEALDLSVRNLAIEWRSEFRRLVERDRRTGRTSDTLPFHLTMSQLSTTFVQYSIEIGRDIAAPPSTNSKDRYSTSTQIVRRIETAPLSTDVLIGTPDTLGEQEMDLLVRAMSHNQANSDTCLGCSQTGHTLTDCNRFVDYIVAESLAQRHPQLKSQVAASHSKFRTRINMRNADSRPPAGGARTVRSILARLPTDDAGLATDTPSVTNEDEDDVSPIGYQLNALRGSFPDSTDDDFDICFTDVDIRSCVMPDVLLPLFESICGDVLPPCTSSDIPPVDSESFLFRRLSETYDPDSRSVFAHADNGSMACTTSDSSLLYSYRALSGTSTKVRLFDAGSHSHHPNGVGFLCLPAYRVPSSSHVSSDNAHTFTPCCVFVRTYHTTSIPGVIISHCAIAKQLLSDGYSMSSAEDRVGLIRFPNKAPSPASEDICVCLQPTRLRGGLTFTESLIIPSPDAHMAALPCGPHRFIVDTLAVISSAPTPDYFPPSSSAVCTLALASVPLPEFTDGPLLPQVFHVNALGRSALRMLWHQRLGHLNFRKLSELHKHTRGLPALSLPDVIDDCAVCMASKLRKAPRGHTNTMTATECLQGLGIDFAFMVQKSSDSKRFDNLVGHNGETCYVLISDHFSGRLVGRAFATKAPPVDWLNQWLASNAPTCANKYVRMDGGGELGRCREILDTFANFGYQTQLTGPDSSHQNGPAERPHQTIGDALRAMLSGANLRASFWPYAFYHYLRLYNFVPHGSRASSPHELCGGELPDLSKLRTFGCRVHVRPTTTRYGRVVPNSRLGIFLGYSRSLKILYYFDLASSLVKTATHARFDEGMNDLVDAPPNVQALRLLSPDGVVPAERPSLSPLNLEVSDDPFHRLDSITQAIRCDHPTLGFEIATCHIRKRGYLSGVAPSTTAARIRNVRRKFIGAYIVSIDAIAVFSCESIVAALTAVATSDATSFTIVFAPDRYIPVNARPNDSPLHLSVDQLRLIDSLRAPASPAPAPPPLPNAAAPEPRIAIMMHEPLPHDQLLLMMRSLNTTAFGTEEEQALGSFTRRKLQRLSNWKDWQLAEAKQLDSMAKQEMYGPAVYPPAGAIILRQHWNYSIKADGTRKARNCCDGSPRAAPALKLANTYSSCIEQPCMRMFLALCANEGYICIKVDATNAYANSPPPDQPTFVYIDQQYADWFLVRYGFDVPRDHVLPVQHALQGHPESGALWERFVNKVLHRHGFKSTTHERSLYHGTYDGWKMLISRQVDDLAIGCRNVKSIRKLVAVICAEDKIDLRDEGVLNSFNGVDIIQSRHYIQVTCESYIDRFLEHYGWSSPGNRESSERPIEPIAMSTIPQLFLDYDNAATASATVLMEYESSAGFSYRSILGCVIYVYVVARIDIGFAVTLLARFSDHPVKIHFDSLRRLARYLRMTKNWGLIYWRPAPIDTFPVGDFVVLMSDTSLPDFPQPQSPTTLAGYVDAAHATDLSTRRSITGLAFMLCGGPIAYKSKVQSTVSTSSTEAEFVAAVQAAKIAKYLRSILLELDYKQPGPTVLYEDNQAAILMINSSRPTPRSRHIDIQHFAIQEWKTNGDIILCHIPGIINPADALTKALGTTLHFRHVRRLMGHYGAPWMTRD